MKPARNDQATSRDGATFVAENTSIKGDIRGKGPYVVWGRVIGDCDIEGPLTLARGGRWQGTLRADSIVIAGTVEGDIVSRGLVEVSGTARIHGSVSGPSITVAEGAIVDGQVSVKTNGAAKKT